jgi:hypothetical protein
MEKKTTEEFFLDKEELKKIIVKDMIKKGHISEDIDIKDIIISEVTKTESEPAADLREAMYYDAFKGIRIRVEY